LSGQAEAVGYSVARTEKVLECYRSDSREMRMSGRAPTAAISPGWPALAARLCVCLLVLDAILSGSASGAPRGEPKRVLMLYSFGRDFLPWSEYARAIRTELERQSPWPLDLQEHNLLSARYNNPGPEAPFIDYLRSLYSGRPPDAVLSIGAPAAKFVQKYRAYLFPTTPMVITAVEQRMVSRTDLTDSDTIISVHNDFSAFFGGILRVLPDTKKIVVITGASLLEKFWLDEIKREAKPFENKVTFVWYADLSFEEILRRASTLPPHTAIFWQLMSVDAAGVTHEGDLALRSLNTVATAPIFSYQEAFFGQSTVGGPMHSVAELSRSAANATIRILGGEKPADIKVLPIGFASPKYDWREMQRWGISESNLPPGSEVLFRERGIWEKHSWWLSLTAIAILIQGGLISRLLHERHRRRFAEVESRQRLAELAHLNRYSTVGELTASIAHEISQPLGSILTNAETAELMLKSSSPDLDELRDIVVDIRRDDQRASEVIRRLRSVLKKTPFEMKYIDLNETIREVIGFVAAVAHGRDIVLKCFATSVDLNINGDAIQLQQVILNLIINAMEAISEAGAKEREISVTTNLSGVTAEIRVRDTGPGIATKDLKTVFDPFFTTKPHGMGMGLAIVRTIVEAHDGQISAANLSSGGALFTIRLPIARGRSTSA
jgi:signal transduction histidine kinase